MEVTAKEAVMMSWYWGTGGWGMVLMAVFWAAILVGTVWLIWRVTRTEGPALPPESPRVALDRRFAAGEIPAEEYANMRRVLEQPRQPAE
jgi:uncharacterized membrane protein